MTKISQIQNALLALDNGEFQKLADAYLHRKGYEQINPLGSVIGKDKTHAGTPDSYIPRPNGKYVFAEHTTTEQKSLFSKMVEDLEKCFDEEKTGLPTAKIEEIVFCHTAVLEPDKEDSLRMECQQRGVNLSIYGIGPLSHDLYQLFPGLAKDFLGIEVDTGQIVRIDEFVVAYNKHSLVTPLDTGFHFRVDELSHIQAAMENSSLVIVAGQAGVGKSRLVLECCNRFLDTHPEFTTRCILNRGLPDLYQDLRVHFSVPGQYLIFVDDANRVSGFPYVLQLLHEQTGEKRFKIVVTVRDYALGKVRDICQAFGGRREFNIEKFKDDEIRDIIKDEFGISNYHYLDRIADISKGNARLAVMAAKIASEENSLESISDVSSLYDQYYDSIRTDVVGLTNPNVLKAAGILSFFRHIDFANQELLGDIEKAFGVSGRQLLEAAKQLHDLEIVDMYENEVFKFSDQVLSTYFFYLSFFKEKVLDFAPLLEHFFPRLQHKIVDSLNPVMNAFDFESVSTSLKPHVDRKWQSLVTLEDEAGLFHLMELFWYLKETDTLIYIRNKISDMEQEQDQGINVPDKYDSAMPAMSILNLLKLFRYSHETEFRVALNLLIEYVKKRPSESAYVMYILEESYGFRHTSYLHGFGVQHCVIDALWHATKDGTDGLISKLFLQVSKYFLRTEFNNTEATGGREFRMISFQLPPTDELFKLRAKLWSSIFKLYGLSAYRESALDVLEAYSQAGYRKESREIIKSDYGKILAFINSDLDPKNIRHTKLVQDYLDLVEESDISVDGAIRERFGSGEYEVIKVLCNRWYDKQNRDLSFNEYELFKLDRIQKTFAMYSTHTYEQLLATCANVNSILPDDSIRYQLKSGLVEVLVWLAGSNEDLYVKVLDHYVSLDDPLALDPDPLVNQLLRICDRDVTISFVKRLTSTQSKWLFGFYRCLLPHQIRLEDIDELVKLFGSSDICVGSKRASSSVPWIKEITGYGGHRCRILSCIAICWAW